MSSNSFTARYNESICLSNRIKASNFCFAKQAPSILWLPLISRHLSSDIFWFKKVIPVFKTLNESTWLKFKVGNRTNNTNKTLIILEFSCYGPNSQQHELFVQQFGVLTGHLYVRNWIMIQEHDHFTLLDKPVVERYVFTPPMEANTPLHNEACFMHIVNGRSKLFTPEKDYELQSSDNFFMKCGS